MNREDEKVRDRIADAFTQNDIDVRSLVVEVNNGAVMVTGSVPTAEQRDRVETVVASVAPTVGVIRVGIGT